jgi:hypothetical protein
MPAPLGNQYAVGADSGRPRKWDRDKVAQDMLEWAKQPDSINLNKFCALYEPPIPPSFITKWANQSEEFDQAYESVKSSLGYRREEMLTNNTLHVKAYDLNATVYDYFIRGERSREFKEKNKLAIELATEIEKIKSQNGSVPPEIQSKVEELFSTIAAHQSARKMACKTNSTESKSACETGESSTCLGSES